MVGRAVPAVASARQAGAPGRAVLTLQHSTLRTKRGGETTCPAQEEKRCSEANAAVPALGPKRGSMQGASLVGALRDSLCLHSWLCRTRPTGGDAPLVATPHRVVGREALSRRRGLEAALLRVAAWQRSASSARRGFHHGTELPHWQRPLAGGMFRAPATGGANFVAGREVEVLCESGWRRGTVELVYSGKVLVGFHSPPPTQPPVAYGNALDVDPGGADVPAPKTQSLGVPVAKAPVMAGVEEGSMGAAKLGASRDGRVHARGLATSPPIGSPETQDTAPSATPPTSALPHTSVPSPAAMGSRAAGAHGAGLGGNHGAEVVGGERGEKNGGERQWVSTVGQSLAHVRIVSDAGIGKVGDGSDRLHEVFSLSLSLFSLSLFSLSSLSLSLSLENPLSHSFWK